MPKQYKENALIINQLEPQGLEESKVCFLNITLKYSIFSCIHENMYYN